jgi:hypothetical protein
MVIQTRHRIEDHLLRKQSKGNNGLFSLSPLVTHLYILFGIKSNSEILSAYFDFSNLRIFWFFFWQERSPRPTIFFESSELPLVHASFAMNTRIVLIISRFFVRKSKSYGITFYSPSSTLNASIWMLSILLSSASNLLHLFDLLKAPGSLPYFQPPNGFSGTSIGSS